MKNICYQNIALIKRNQELEKQNEDLKKAVRVLKDEIPKDKKAIKIQKKLNQSQDRLNKLEESFEGLKKQMDYERETYLCKICFDNPREILYFPCQHLAVCKSCDYNLDECPICRQPVENQITPYTL